MTLSDPLQNSLINLIPFCYISDSGKGFNYQSVKDAVEIYPNNKRKLIKMLMEIGTAICLDSKRFKELYSQTTQETFLKSVKFLKSRGKVKREKLLREYGLLKDDSPREEPKFHQF